MAINLSKGGDKHSINLVKGEKSLLIHANLNWTSAKQSGFLSMLTGKKEVDLDLGCMYELLDGSKGVLQPLGNAFGSRDSPPFIFLDKDDRSGSEADGENMHVYKPELVKRILFFGLIYAGAKDFHSVEGQMSFKISNGDEVRLQLDNVGVAKPFCAGALIVNDDGRILIQKEALYFPGHKEADAHYGFGFKWVAGSKD